MMHCIWFKSFSYGRNDFPYIQGLTLQHENVGYNDKYSK
jgi:hypothetical protein